MYFCKDLQQQEHLTCTLYLTTIRTYIRQLICKTIIELLPPKNFCLLWGRREPISSKKNVKCLLFLMGWKDYITYMHI